MDNFRKATYLKLLFLLCVAILITAYSIQYVFGFQPCNLCIVERIPFMLAIIVLILNYKFKKNELFHSILLMMIFTFSFLISVYHFGIEQGFIDESSFCGVNKADLTTKEDILKSLQNINVSCKDVAFKIFDLSLTTYNMLISIIMLLISLKIYLINNEIKK